MSRTLPYLAELQPEFFVEVVPQLADERGLENGGWATVVTGAGGGGGAGAGDASGCGRCGSRAGGSCTRSASRTTGASRASRPATRPTTCWASSWTRTPTSRRARPRPATSGRDAVRAGRSCWSSSRSTAGGPGCSPAPSRSAAGHRWRPNEPAAGRRRRASGHDDGELGEPGLKANDPEEPAVRAAARRRRRRPATSRRAPGAGRLLHRHLGLHRLQGLRGGLQGVEHAPDGRLARQARRPRAVGDVLRQHRPARREHLAARGLHRAGAHGRPADAGRRPAGRAAGDAGPGRRRARARQPGQGAGRACSTPRRWRSSTRRPRSRATGRSAG